MFRYFFFFTKYYRISSAISKLAQEGLEELNQLMDKDNLTLFDILEYDEVVT
jgi:hypothetical protein